MLRTSFYTMQNVYRRLSNIKRRKQRAPDYIIFTLAGSYPDTESPPQGLIKRRLVPSETSLQELSKQIRRVAGDPRIKGVILHLAHLPMPLARIQSMRKLVFELREAGKEVIAWSTVYDTAKYYLATAATRILIQPGGRIDPIGLREEYLFYTDLLNWCGIEFDIVRISPYKSAADRFICTTMSRELREMTDWLMDSFYDQIIESIASGRAFSKDKALTLIDTTPLTATKAHSSELLDGIVNLEDLSEFLVENNKKQTLKAWAEATGNLPYNQIEKSGNYIALLQITGTIVDGRSRKPAYPPPLPVPLLFSPQTGDLTFVQEARKALRDRNAAAVLLYVNSGGGSATASEAINAALRRLATKKPLVVFMGPMAASGGYYVTTPAHWITAQPATITGSIGVINGKITDIKLLQRLLVNKETVTRGNSASFYSFHSPFTPQQRKKIYDQIEYTYNLFLERVATGRNKTTAAIDAIGGGKVWTGVQAKEHDLIDELGGLKEAVHKAKILAGLPPGTPLRTIGYGRKGIAPPISPLNYALKSLTIFQSQPLLICPLSFIYPQPDYSLPGSSESTWVL